MLGVGYISVILRRKSILWTTFVQLKAYFKKKENIGISEVHYLYGWGGRIGTYGTRYQKTVETLIIVLMSFKIKDLRYHLYHGLSTVSQIWATIWATTT